MYTFFVILHILSAGVIIGLATMSIILSAMRKKAKGKVGELTAIHSEAIIGPIMANIGSNGLLFSGVVLTLMKYSFFPFSSELWLALKQSIFVFILILSFTVLKPLGTKVLNMVNAELVDPNAENGASIALRALVNKQYAMTLFVIVLALVAVALGEAGYL